MSITVLDPRIHYVKETQVCKFFRRILREPSIMTFFHAETENWILGMWVHRRRRVVEEFEDLGTHMEAVTPAFVEMLVSCYGNVDMGRTKKRLLAKNHDRIRRQSEEILSDQERWDWLKKKTEHKAPIPYTFMGG